MTYYTRWCHAICRTFLNQNSPIKITSILVYIPINIGVSRQPCVTPCILHKAFAGKLPIGFLIKHLSCLDHFALSPDTLLGISQIDLEV